MRAKRFVEKTEFSSAHGSMEPKKRKFREEEEDRRVWDRESGLTAVQNSRAEIEAGAREKKTKVGGFNRWMGEGIMYCFAFISFFKMGTLYCVYYEMASLFTVSRV